MKKLNIIEKLILVGSICFCSICSAKVITYPVPISEKVITSYDVFVNGEKIDTNYARYENEYVAGGKVERESKIIAVEYEEYWLYLDYESGVREYGKVEADN